MTETTPDLPPAVRSRRVSVRRLAVAGLVAAVGVGAFAVGHGTSRRQDSTSGTAACRAAVQSFTTEFGAASGGAWSSLDAAGQQHVRTGAHIALQNPSCFNPTTVGAAQTMLDEMDLKNLQDAANSRVQCAPAFSRLC